MKFSRLKFSFSILIANWAVFFMSTDADRQVLGPLREKWGYSWSAFLTSPLHSLALSPFLHKDYAHICTNTLLLLIFTVALEWTAGSAFTAICYIVSMLAANPLTSLVLIAAGLKSVAVWGLDIGASLGIFGTIGGLAVIAPRWRIPAAVIAVAMVAHVFTTGDFKSLNHVVALVIGGALFLKKQRHSDKTALVH